MKRIIYFFMLITLLLGCSEEGYIDDKYVSGISSDFEKIKTVVKLLKLDESTIIDKGDYYLVEGDIAFKKGDVDYYLASLDDSKPQLRHGVKPGRTVFYDKVQNITIRIDGAVPTYGKGKEWRDAIPRAITAWNNIPGSLVRFRYTTASSADLTVKRYNTDDGVFAYTYLPFQGNPPKELFVNEYWNENTSLNQKTNTIIHEFGHVVGLLHTHLAPSQEGGMLIPGTPVIDESSIMSYLRDRSLYPGFNRNDLYAIRYLYPAGSLLSSSRQNVCENEMVTYTLSNGTSTTIWEAVENATLMSGQGTSQATFRLHGNGFARIVANIYNSGILYSIMDADVWVGVPPAPEIYTGTDGNGQLSSGYTYGFGLRYPSYIKSITMYELNGKQSTSSSQSFYVRGSYFSVSGRIKNSCGWSPYAYSSYSLTSKPPASDQFGPPVP